jgi:FkbM family methyltransferase
MSIIGDKSRRNVLVSTDHGVMIVNRFDYFVGSNKELIGHGQWLLDHGNCDTVEAFICIKILESLKNPVMFDVGSNIGTIATLIGNILRSSDVYCFEPQEDVYKILCGNLAINNLHNCHAYNIAFGNENKIITVDEPDYNVPNDFGIFSLIENKIPNINGRKIVIDVYQIDTFIKKYNIQRLDLLKIDAEGMDLEILYGAKETIERFNPVILVEYSDNRKSIRDALENYLTKEKYNFIAIGNNLLSIPREYPIPDLRDFQNFIR